MVQTLKTPQNDGSIRRYFEAFIHKMDNIKSIIYSTYKHKDGLRLGSILLCLYSIIFTLAPLF